jgi:hypothetical protein
VNGKRWTVMVDIGERNGSLRAVARLFTRDDDDLQGVGSVQLDMAERRAPKAGYELAVARALAALSKRLSDEATEELAHPGEPTPSR